MKLACGRCWDRDCKCSTQELKEWNSVKEKMYSKQDLIELSMGNSTIIEWIKENLKQQRYGQTYSHKSR